MYQSLVTGEHMNAQQLLFHYLKITYAQLTGANNHVPFSHLIITNIEVGTHRKPFLKNKNSLPQTMLNSTYSSYTRKTKTSKNSLTSNNTPNQKIDKNTTLQNQEKPTEIITIPLFEENDNKASLRNKLKKEATLPLTVKLCKFLSKRT